MTRILLIRHGHAGDRAGWSGDDHLRPLTDRGRQQAEALVAALDGRPVDHLLSSGFLRCVQTLEPLGAARGLTVEPFELLEEGADARAALERLLVAGDVAACSHGDVISGILFDLADQGVHLGSNPRMQKGSTWILDVEGSAIAGARYVPPPD
jgi:broad specificity phosphatase PhoE